MKKRTLLYLFTFLLALPAVKSWAQEDSLAYKRLLISEVYLSGVRNHTNLGYIELYNASDKTLNLSDYWLQSGWSNSNGAWDQNAHKLVLSGQLEPKSTWLYEVRATNENLDPWGERLYPDHYFNHYIDAMADVIKTEKDRWGSFPGASGTIIALVGRVALYHRGDTSTVQGVVARDSSKIDMFMGDGSFDFPVAGVLTDNPQFDYCYVRKSKFKLGNPDFDISRGSNMEDSEWIVLPKTNLRGPYDKPYTTIGSHSSQAELEMTPNVPGIQVDKENEVISFPYGIRRDSLFRYFDFGPEHAWELRIGEDTSQWFVSTGDTIDIYVCGDKVTKYSFHANVEDIPSDFVKARPINYQNSNGSWFRKYIVSDGEEPMDTISGIDAYTPTDTLMKYLTVEKNASVEFIFADGKEHVELNPGDKLKVTSGDASKTYILSVDRYAPSHDADLRSIYMPGMYLWENPNTFEMTDTLIDFSPNVKSYVVELPAETINPPAIVATAKNNRTRVHVARPANLNGDDAARSAVITVTAEDDTTINKYIVLFNVTRETPPVMGTPFISDIAFTWVGTNNRFNMQVYNPTDEILDLTDYVFVRQSAWFPAWSDFVARGSTNSSSMFGDRSSDEVLNQGLIRPGYWVQPDAEQNPIFDLDPAFTESELGPKEVYSIMTIRGYPSNNSGLASGSDDLRALLNKVDLIVGNRAPGDGGVVEPWSSGWFWEEKLGYSIEEGTYPYGEENMWKWSQSEPQAHSGHSWYILKFKDTESADSIKDGLKPIDSNFDEDFEMIDVFNGKTLNGIPYTVYDNTWGKDTVYRFDNSKPGYRGACFMRRPNIYKGNPEDGASFGTPNRNGEWMVYGIAPGGAIAKETIEGVQIGCVDFGQPQFENHKMTSYAHIPYLTSEKYFMGKGLEGQQPIFGVAVGTSVSTFFENINKPDPEMTVTMTDAEGNVVTENDMIATGYKLKSTAANGLTSVDYLITVGELSGDVSLVAKDGSGLTVEGLAIKDVPFGSSLKDLMDKLIAPTLAKVVVTDGNEQIIPMEKYNSDTILIEEKTKTDVLASSAYEVEVTAQNGEKAAYKIEFVPEAEVYVLSDSYKVYEEYKTIDFVWWTNVSSFLSRIVASPGASVKVINKINQVREAGLIQFDDRLLVEKGDVKVLYRLKFINDERWMVNVNEVNETDGFTLYPNPTQGDINMNGLSVGHKLIVHDLMGKRVAQYNVVSTNMNLSIDGPAGIYFVTVLDGEKMMRSLKVIKQ